LKWARPRDHSLDISCTIRTGPEPHDAQIRRRWRDSEEMALTGEQIGNFPQVFSHLSLMDAAICLNEAPPTALRKGRRA
jgi:hypothetical protein